MRSFQVAGILSALLVIAAIVLFRVSNDTSTAAIGVPFVSFVLVPLLVVLLAVVWFVASVWLAFRQARRQEREAEAAEQSRFANPSD